MRPKIFADGGCVPGTNSRPSMYSVVSPDLDHARSKRTTKHRNCDVGVGPHKLRLIHPTWSGLPQPDSELSQRTLAACSIPTQTFLQSSCSGCNFDFLLHCQVLENTPIVENTYVFEQICSSEVRTMSSPLLRKVKWEVGSSAWSS